MDASTVNDINNKHENTSAFLSIKLSKNIIATNNIADIDFQKIDFIINAIPTQYTRSVYKKIAGKIDNKTIVVNASKGIENDSLALPLEIIKEELGEDIYKNSCVLSGPSFAVEVMNQLPTAVSIGGLNKVTLHQAQNLFHTPFLELTPTQIQLDWKFVEL